MKKLILILSILIPLFGYGQQQNLNQARSYDSTFAITNQAFPDDTLLKFRDGLLILYSSGVPSDTFMLKSELIPDTLYSQYKDEWLHIGDTIPIQDSLDKFYADTAIFDTASINKLNVNDNLILKEQSIFNYLSTGIKSGFEISINTDSTKINIASGIGYVVDNKDPNNPLVYPINYAGQTGISITNIAIANASYIAIDSTGTVIQQITPFTPSQRRYHLILGAVIHSNRVKANVVNNLPDIALEGICQLNDLADALSNFNISGNVFSENGTNLHINKSTGKIFKKGANFNNDVANPHTLNLSSLTAPSNIRYRLQDGTEYVDTNNIDPNNYDLSGVLTAVPNNKFTNQRIILFSSNIVRIQYGQKVYNDLAEAQMGASLDPFILEDNINQNGLCRATLCVKEGITDLQTAIANGEAIFIETDFRGGTQFSCAGAATTTLQGAYNNSEKPQIITSSDLGELQIKQNSGSDNDTVFSILNGDNVSSFSILGNGKTIVDSVLKITNLNRSDSATLIIDSDTTRIESNNPIKIGNNSFVMQTNGYGYFSSRLGIGEASPTSLLHLNPSTTNYSQFRLESSASVNPSAPNSGDLWWNGTNLNFYDGVSTTDLLTDVSPGGSDGDVQFNNAGSFGNANDVVTGWSYKWNGTNWILSDAGSTQYLDWQPTTTGYLDWYSETGSGNYWEIYIEGGELGLDSYNSSGYGGWAALGSNSQTRSTLGVQASDGSHTMNLDTAGVFLSGHHTYSWTDNYLITQAHAANMIHDSIDGLGSYIFNSGLTESAGTVNWGGALANDVTITGAGATYGITLGGPTSQSLSQFTINSVGIISLSSTSGTISLSGNGLGIPDYSGDPTGSNGLIVYNSTAGKFRGYQAGSWIDLINAPGGNNREIQFNDNGVHNGSNNLTYSNERVLNLSGVFVSGIGTITNGDATPNVQYVETLIYNGTSSSVTITDLDNPVVGAYYTLIGNSDTYTVTINDSGNFNLNTTRILGADDVLVVRCMADNDYIEINYSDN